jgi:hypothetical protein
MFTYGRAIIAVRISLGENRASLEMRLTEWRGDFTPVIIKNSTPIASSP